MPTTSSYTMPIRMQFSLQTALAGDLTSTIQFSFESVALTPSIPSGH